MNLIVLTGNAVIPHLDDLAQLRMTVFREYPYLYEGDLAYEHKYLKTYAESDESLFVLALDGEKVVGASTGIPMANETIEFRRPFINAGFNPDSIFYFGESVLLPGYRGKGIGVKFFEEREHYAQQLGRITHCCFCAIDRPENHPMKPENYQPLHQFWKNRGYQHHPELATTYRWKELGEVEESPKPMSFWIKNLNE